MRKRNCRVEVYFTKAELDALTKKVRKTHLSRECYIRRALAEAPLHEAPQAEYYDLLRELRYNGTLLRELYEYTRPGDPINAEKLEKALAQNRATECMLWDTFLVEP